MDFFPVSLKRFERWLDLPLIYYSLKNQGPKPAYFLPEEDRNSQKQRDEYPQMLLQPIHGQNITNSSEVICNKHKSYISTCPGYSLFSENITEALPIAIGIVLLFRMDALQ